MNFKIQGTVSKKLLPAHINSTKESVSSSSRDASKHTPTEKRPAVTASQHKRNSWLSNLSSKFISTSTYLQSSHSAINTTLSVAGNTEIPASPSPSYIKCAVLAHAQKPIGDEPYIPALPRTSHQSFIQNAFRRLSSSNNLGSQAQIEVHHVNERKILNVDKNRRRCEVEGLNQSKLRRVAFCVDIQVMEGLKYHEVGKKEEIANYEENGKEKRNTILERSKSNNEGMKIIKDKNSSDIGIPGSESDIGYFVVTKKISRKKQKKKRNEEERKAKKDQKKKLAEAHGRVPLEVTINHSVASLRTSASSLKQEKCATLDPLRIYKRCCLLRETSALKRVAEQLADPTNHSRSPGVINRLDLTGYHMDMSDTVTFSDFLALVPVNDLVMENCGLNDECVRIILAGLLSTRHPELEGNKLNKCKFSGASQGGFVTRVVLKNNSRIGRDGWQYICTFIALCHSLKSIDLSKITIPQLPHDSEDFESPGADKNSRVNEVSCMLRNALSGRPGSCDFKLLNMAECGLSSAQIRNLVDGVIKAGLCRLGLAGNNIQPEGLQHIGRYLRNSHCEGLDLAGNNLKDQIKIIADSLTEKGSLHSLSLAKCNLSSESMSNLFPVLINLKSFKFINLSNNPELFSTEPSAIPLFRR
ncbi:hypothetical protein HI914_01071 [Erysiphe necator]|nr:hypothetical protein HI914_01071 [Erysiphe necator]